MDGAPAEIESDDKRGDKLSSIIDQLRIIKGRNKGDRHGALLQNESILLSTVKLMRNVIDALINAEVIILTHRFIFLSYTYKSLYLLSGLLSSPGTIAKRIFYYIVRRNVGEFVRIYKTLESYPEMFFAYLKMTQKTFNFILARVKCQLERTSTNPIAISAEERLVITLRFFTTGQSFNKLALCFKVDKNLVEKIVNDTCEVLIDVLGDEYFPILTKNKRLSVAEKYFDKWNFPNCLGGIDGKLLNVQRTVVQNNFKKKLTLQFMMQIVADADNKIISSHLYYSGNSSAGASFIQSPLYSLMESYDPEIPEPISLPLTTDDIQVPYVFLGNEEFPLLPHLMRPYTDAKHISDEERIFNYRLNRALHCVEKTLTMMLSKWRLLSETLDEEETNPIKILKTICLLHNLLMEREINVSYVNGGVEGLRTEMPRFTTMHSTFSDEAFDIREIYRDYFSGDGSLTWQDYHSLAPYIN